MSAPTTSTPTPSKPESRVRHVRIPDDPWILAAQRANDEGETISTVTRILLRKYARGEIDL